jgi:hypothetical protein
MANLISFPFRLTKSGSVATHEDGTSEAFAEQLAVLVMTRVEERDLVPDFGINDPVFNNFDPAELTTKVQMFGPPVKIVNITSSFKDDTTQNIRVTFDHLPEEQSFVVESGDTETITI